MAKLRLMKPWPRPMNELMLVSPGVFLSTFSCGSMMLASMSSGAAARQKLATETCGSSIVGSSWIGRDAIELMPNSATSATAAATDGQCRVLNSVMFIILGPPRAWSHWDHAHKGEFSAVRLRD